MISGTLLPIVTSGKESDDMVVPILTAKHKIVPTELDDIKSITLLKHSGKALQRAMSKSERVNVLLSGEEDATISYMLPAGTWNSSYHVDVAKDGTVSLRSFAIVCCLFVICIVDSKFIG